MPRRHPSRDHMPRKACISVSLPSGIHTTLEITCRERHASLCPCLRAYTITEGETARVAPELPLALVWPSGGGETAWQYIAGRPAIPLRSPGQVRQTFKALCHVAVRCPMRGTYSPVEAACRRPTCYSSRPVSCTKNAVHEKCISVCGVDGIEKSLIAHTHTLHTHTNTPGYPPRA